jgi:hypothetical protein
VKKAPVARAICLRGVESDKAVREELRAANSLVSTRRYQAGEIFALVADTLQSVHTNDLRAAVANRTAIARIESTLGAYGFWGEIVGWWITARDNDFSHSPIRSTREAAWLDGSGATRARWLEALSMREAGGFS